MEGKVCTKCEEWKVLEEYAKNKNNKDGRESRCKECIREYNKRYYQNNKEKLKENQREYQRKNHQDYKEYQKKYQKEHQKEYYKKNKEKLKEYGKQWRESHKEYHREYRKEWYSINKESRKEYAKQLYDDSKKNNLKHISNLLGQISPIFNQLKLPVYGYIYKFENIKTGHVYIGQTTLSLKERYETEIIQGWIKHRKSFKNQKFKEELIEKDIQVTEVLDVAFCQYHLDKLESWYIDKYDSCNNGYNNYAGNHNTDDGIEEFNQILSEHNLEFKDGKLIQIKSTYPR